MVPSVPSSDTINSLGDRRSCRCFSFYSVELAKLLLWRNVLSGVNEAPTPLDCIRQQYIQRHITAPLESSCLQSAMQGRDAVCVTALRSNQSAPFSNTPFRREGVL